MSKQETVLESLQRINREDLEREKFEDFVKRVAPQTEHQLYMLDSDGEYKTPAMHWGWTAWQAATETKQGDSWIKCSERMPADELEVLITCDGDRHVAFCVSEKSISVDDRSFDGDTVYDDETDQSYWPSGWYVWNDGAEAWWNVHLAVTHWQPLPALPANDSGVQ